MPWPGEAVLKVRNLPAEFHKPGLCRALLDAAGYQAVQIPAGEHYRSAVTALGDPVIDLPDRGIVCSIVQPPADDASLSRLPRKLRIPGIPGKVQLSVQLSLVVGITHKQRAVRPANTYSRDGMPASLHIVEVPAQRPFPGIAELGYFDEGAEMPPPISTGRAGQQQQQQQQNDLDPNVPAPNSLGDMLRRAKSAKQLRTLEDRVARQYNKRQLVNLLFSFHRLHQSGYLSLSPPQTAVPATARQAATQPPAVQPALHPASEPPAAVVAAAAATGTAEVQAAVHPAAVSSAAVAARALATADSRQPSLSQPGPATPQQHQFGLRRGFLGARPSAAGDAGMRQPLQQEQQQQHASQPQRRTSQRRKSKHLQAAEQELQNWHIILAGEKEALQQHIHDSQEQLHTLDQELAAARVRHQQELHQLQQGRESVQAGLQQHQSDMLQVAEQLGELDDQKALLQQQRAELEQQLGDLTVQAHVPDVSADPAHAAAAASTPAMLAHPPSISKRHRARRLRAKQQRQQQHSHHQQQPGQQHQLSQQQQLQQHMRPQQGQQQPVGEQQSDPQLHRPVQVVPRQPAACRWPDLPDSEFSISYQVPQDQHAHALADEAETAAHSANLAAADHQTWSEVVSGAVTEDETEAVSGARSDAFGEEEWLYEQGVYDGYSSEEYEGLEGDPLFVGPPINPAALRAANTAVLRNDYYWGGPNPFIFGGYRNMLERDDAQCPSDSTDMSE